MPHIFRFHAGRNNNIYDWTPSDRIQPADVRDVMDKTNILTSSAGTSIPTPIARMFLFKTAFEIVAAQVRDDQADSKSIYSGLVSETLDLLELLYKSGSDDHKFRYEKWLFDSQQDDSVILKFFGNDHGHRLLAESFKQAAAQEPFNKKIEITLIYYKEGNKEILVGGTSPFTFVFTSPNFSRKMRELAFRSISGLVSNDILFDSDYKQLYERDDAFIKYVENLANTPGISQSFSGFTEYVLNTKRRKPNRFNGTIAELQDIQINDTPLTVSNINLKQLSEDDYKKNINLHSDFKIVLPEDSFYDERKTKCPLLLLDKMSYDGQYSSPSSHWSPSTRVSDLEYTETRLEDIKERELPGLDGFHYPFLSSFDFFERCLIKLPGYALNNERFLCLADNQSFIFPLKPLFFHFFPITKIKNYVSIESKGDQITVILKIPVFGPTKPVREFICRKTYDNDSIINYSGILGIFPFTKTTQKELLHINKYTVASYEKTNEPLLLDSVSFFKKDGIRQVASPPIQRSNYSDLNTKTIYYQVNESFDIIQLNFRKDNSDCGGVIIPLFKEVEDGTESYVYAIDFGTSNTHIEYGKIENDKVTNTSPFTIEERGMQMILLNKPKEIVINDGAERYNDYERSMGFKIDTARKVTLREFVPFQIGNQKSASVKFPFRTATCESNAFIANQANNRLFVDANIGFHIDDDAFFDNIRYKTDLKWLLERANKDQFNINRISIFFRELLLMIRTKVLMEDNNQRGKLANLKIALSYPMSMGDILKNSILEIFNKQALEILGDSFNPIKNATSDNRLVTESIAPYYFLKHSKSYVQNDSYCNIDIGGGTTDVILIDPDKNPNQLLCYCASFKFAGRQLWSSGKNEFNHSDNGFIAYYKNFIQRIDKTSYDELERMLNGNASRTEDVVGFLFSKPQYKFSDIFTDYQELKVVPLLHYTAILFYITRLAKYKNVKLPRTISFSGKGSEYLSLIFPSDNDLKGYTQKVLGLFSGETINSAFSIERSKEPKVITAKGTAHFSTENIKQKDNDWGNDSESSNTNEKELVTPPLEFRCFKNQANENLTLTYGSFAGNSEYYKDIMSNQLEFFTLLFDNQELCGIINKRLQLKDFAKYKQFFIPSNGNIFDEGKLRDSFKTTLDNFNSTDNATDSPFFFALNYSLIELSREIAATALKK